MIDKWLSQTKFKQSYEKFISKIFFERVSANQLTIIGLIIGLCGGFLIFLSGVILQIKIPLIVAAAITIGTSFMIDTFDGAIARYKEPTVFGGILDIFCDRTVEISIIIAIVSTDSINLIYPGLFSLGAMVLCISMFLIVGGLAKREEIANSKVINYRRGFMERSETFIFLMLITILYPWRFILLWIFASLILITALLRLKDAYKLFRSK